MLLFVVVLNLTHYIDTASFSVLLFLLNSFTSLQQLAYNIILYTITMVIHQHAKTFFINLQLEFCSFHTDDEDYEGYNYSLRGQLSEVRIIYLNRFIQEVC